MRNLIENESQYQPEVHTNIENWYALAICVLANTPVSSDKALIAMGLSEHLGEKKRGLQRPNISRRHGAGRVLD